MLLHEARPGFKPGDIVQTASGEVVPFEELHRACIAVPVVFVGESHIQISHHEVELDIIRDMEASGRNVVIAMEMFIREDQPVLDAWTRGELDEKTFLEKVDWEHNWGYPFLLYRDIVQEARVHSLELLGLNAPPEVVRRVARKGLSGLDPEDRARIAHDIVLDLPEYRAYVHTQFEEHPSGDAASFEFFYEAQRTWDETMAEVLARRVRVMTKNDVIVVLAGAGHVYKGYGIPEGLRRRTGVSYVTLLPASPARAADAVRERAARFVWVTEDKPLVRPRLGVILDPKLLEKGELVVDRVVPGSTAEKIGILPGDVLEALNGVKLETARDVFEALLKKEHGAKHRIRIGRDGLHIELEFTLAADQTSSVSDVTYRHT